jgi:hypothetical protein
MKGRTLLPLAVLSLALACEGTQQAGPTAPPDPSKIIQDGAHGGNKDFWWLPPMVPLAWNNPDFVLGTFNNALRPSLRIEICQLDGLHLNAQGVPTEQTACISGTPKKTFPAGTVNLVNLPLVQNGWWNLFNLPPDGFYYVLWDTRQSDLKVNKFYRIRVFLQGKSDALGVADVDPISNLRQWKYSLTGQVIQLVDDVMLPITFRIERGALCDGGTCNSATITNSSPTGTQSVTVDAGGGSIAGALFPNGWLPSGSQCPTGGSCPQSVVVTISEVNTGESGICHPGIPFIQFRGCFHYTTTPTLQSINEAGDQFTQPVTVAVCFELQGSGDPREKFAELYASGPNEPAHALEDVSEGALLGVETKDCDPAPVIGATSSNPLVQLASTGWRNLKGGLGRAFGVKTAYAVDLGLGGIVKGFSNIGPVLPAHIEAYGPSSVSFEGGLTVALSSIISGNHVHHGEGAYSGINTVPATFSVTGANGYLRASEFAPQTSQVTVNSANLTIQEEEGFTQVPGISTVMWTPPSIPETYHMTVTGPATGGPVTYTVVVTQPPLVNIEGTWDNEVQSGANISKLVLGVTGFEVTSVHAYGNCVPTLCDWGSENADESRWNGHNELSTVFHDEVATRTVTINYLSASRIKVSVTAVFNNGSGQYSTVEYFHRVT